MTVMLLEWALERDIQRVYALNKKGVIPEELATLTYLTFL
ncbi:hypothetical protein CK203_024992 [Vitis vinifera]|uniref:Uncharacterized protein n=1 Tax=Vitis vinifera TaxID=29760 RepID=A0A438J706_VITVI|nr:hypothetical protein CK203_024992 [Vitis vinifera]